MAWCDDDIVFMRATLGAGWSASRVAGELSERNKTTVSRMAIIGKARRMGILFKAKPKHNGHNLKRPPPLPPPPKEKGPASRRTFAAAPTKHEYGRKQIALVKPVGIIGPSSKKCAPVFCDEPPLTGSEKTLMELGPQDCRWPIGDPQEKSFRYCGVPHAPAVLQPYCDAHQRMNMRTGSDRRPPRPPPERPFLAYAEHG